MYPWLNTFYSVQFSSVQLFYDNGLSSVYDFCPPLVLPLIHNIGALRLSTYTHIIAI
jgi:hypothetical protein